MTEEQRGQFVELCRRGSKNEVVKFLKRNGKNIANMKDSDYDQTPLHICAENGHEEVCLYLIEKCKADVNAVDKNGWTPLHSSASAGNVAVLEVLLNHGAFARALTNEGASALHYFVRNPSSDPIVLHRVLKAFVEKGADVDQQNKHGEAPLHQAAMRGRTQCVLYLLNNKANPNIVSYNGETPLHFATRAGHEECMNVLLQWGADPTIESKKTGTCVDISQRWNSPKMFHMLANHFEEFGKEPPATPEFDETSKSTEEKELPDLGTVGERAGIEDEDVKTPFKRSSSEVSLRGTRVRKDSRSKSDRSPDRAASDSRSEGSEAAARDHSPDGAEATTSAMNPVLESKKAKFSRGRSNSFTSVRAIRSNFEREEQKEPLATARSPGTSRLRSESTTAASGGGGMGGDDADAAEVHSSQTGNKYGTPRVRKTRADARDKSKRSSRVVSLVRNFERFAGLEGTQSEPNVSSSKREKLQRKGSKSRLVADKVEKADKPDKPDKPEKTEKGSERDEQKRSKDGHRPARKSESKPEVSSLSSLSGSSATMTPERDEGDGSAGESPAEGSVGSLGTPLREEEERTEPKQACEDLCPPRMLTSALSEAGQELFKDGWNCCLCNEQRKKGVPLAFFARGPDDWELLKENRDKRSRLSPDVCSIDNVSFFIRGLLKVSINTKGGSGGMEGADGEKRDYSPVFTFGVWVKVSTQDFFRALEDWSSKKRTTYDGVLNTRLPLYPDTNGLKVRLSCENNGTRPSLDILTMEHELVRDWKSGMSMKRFENLLQLLYVP